MTASEAKSMHYLRKYSQEVAARRVEDDPAVQRWHVAKRIVWMITLAGVFLIYYLIDKMHEAISILN